MSSPANKETKKKHWIFWAVKNEQFMIPLKNRSWDESIYSRSFGTTVRISRICKEDSFSRRSLYLVTWRKILTAPRSKGWSDVLTLKLSDCNLQFHFLTLNWKECFPNWNVLKSISIGTLVSNLKNILEIMEEGSSWETYVPMNSNKEVEHW